MDIEKRPLGRDVKPSQRSTTSVDSEPATAPTPPTPPKKRRSALTAVLVTLLVLALAGLGGMWWLMSQQDEKLKSSESEVSRQEGVIKDLQHQVNDLQATASGSDDSQATVEASDDDSTAVIEAARRYVQAMNTNNDPFELNIIKSSTEFASVGVSFEQGSGFAVMLKKVDGDWVAVYSGQMVDQATRDRFGVPSDF